MQASKTRTNWRGREATDRPDGLNVLAAAPSFFAGGRLAPSLASELYPKKESDTQRGKPMSKESRAARFAGKTSEQRAKTIRIGGPPTEFEIQAHLYSGLLALGIAVRGEVGTSCKTARFDLVISEGGKIVRIIEVKKDPHPHLKCKRKKMGRAQSRSYTRFGVPVTLVIGMVQAEEFLAHVRDTGRLPEPNFLHEKPLFQIQQEAAEAQRLHDIGGPQSEQAVTITAEMFRAAACESGSYKATQLGILGIEWPLKSKWKKRIIGRVFSKDQYERFLAFGRSTFTNQSSAS